MSTHFKHDFVQRTSQSAANIKQRKRKFGGHFFRPNTTSRQPERVRESQGSVKSPPRNILSFILGIVCLLALYFIITTTSPTTVKDILIPNVYLPVIMLFFFGVFFTLNSILNLFFRSFLISFSLSLLLFFKLTAVFFQISLILPLLVIFVIIDMLYNKKSKA